MTKIGAATITGSGTNFYRKKINHSILRRPKC